MEKRRTLLNERVICVGEASRRRPMAALRGTRVRLGATVIALSVALGALALADDVRRVPFWVDSKSDLDAEFPSSSKFQELSLNDLVLLVVTVPRGSGIIRDEVFIYVKDAKGYSLVVVRLTNAAKTTTKLNPRLDAVEVTSPRGNILLSIPVASFGFDFGRHDGHE